VSGRRLILGLGLLAAAGWSAWAVTRGEDDAGADVVLAVRRASPVPAAAALATPSATGSASWEPPRRPPAPATMRNLFGNYSYAAARPVLAPPPPEPPHAPPLPFAFSGRMNIDGQATYILLRGDAPIEVALGADVGDFKLVEATADRLLFLHGPTGERVALPTRAAPGN
jgi:hypothetical protein